MGGGVEGKLITSSSHRKYPDNYNIISEHFSKYVHKKKKTGVVCA